MRYDFFIATLYFSMASFLIFAAVYIFTRRELLIGIRIVGLLAVANVFYLIGHAAVILSDQEIYILIYYHIYAWGLIFIPVFWNLVSSQQKNKSVKIKKRGLAILFIIPAIALISELIFPWNVVSEDLGFIQSLFFRGYEIILEGNISSGFVGIIFSKGIVFYILISFNVIMYFLSARNYYISYQKKQMSSKTNAYLMVLTSLLFALLSGFGFWGSKTVLIDFSPILTSIAVLIAFYALFKFELFDLTPLAYRQVYEEATSPVFILDKDRFVLSMNDSARNLYQFKFNIRDPFSIEAVYDNNTPFVKNLFHDKNKEIVFTKGGKKTYYSVVVEELYRSAKLKGYLLTYQDITAHKMEMMKMEYMATYDDLTKIYNRRIFYVRATEDFDEAVINKTPISFIIFDLDDFKDINDIYGHLAGDYILAEMATTISKELDGNILFARYGGEEFVMSIKGASPEEAYEVANRIRKLLEKHSFVYEKHKIKVTASFGVSGTSKQITKSFEQFLKEADEALYVSKNNGKNQVSIKE